MKSLCEPQVTTPIAHFQGLEENLPISTNLFRFDGVGCEILIPILQNPKLSVVVWFLRNFNPCTYPIHVAEYTLPIFTSHI